MSMARFQDLWTKHSVRSSIMKTMLGDLVKAPIPVDADGSVSEGKFMGWDRIRGLGEGMRGPGIL